MSPTLDKKDGEFEENFDNEDSGSCENCGGELKSEKVTLEEVENGKLYVMENVPARVCQDCGEQWIPEPVLKEFEKMLELTQKPKVQGKKSKRSGGQKS